MSHPSPRIVAALLVVWLAWLVYTLLALQNVLAGLFPAAVVLVAYYAWRLLVAIEAVANGVHRLADAHETAADER